MGPTCGPTGADFPLSAAAYFADHGSFGSSSSYTVACRRHQPNGRAPLDRDYRPRGDNADGHRERIDVATSTGESGAGWNMCSRAWLDRGPSCASWQRFLMRWNPRPDGCVPHGSNSQLAPEPGRDDGALTASVPSRRQRPRAVHSHEGTEQARQQKDAGPA